MCFLGSIKRVLLLKERFIWVIGAIFTVWVVLPFFANYGLGVYNRIYYPNVYKLNIPDGKTYSLDDITSLDWVYACYTHKANLLSGNHVNSRARNYSKRNNFEFDSTGWYGDNYSRQAFIFVDNKGTKEFFISMERIHSPKNTSFKYDHLGCFRKGQYNFIISAQNNGQYIIDIKKQNNLGG